MKRANPTKIALVLLLLGVTSVVLVFALRRPAPRPAALALARVTELAPVLPVDTPPQPQPRPAAGWPFAQLPHVAKFEAPVPRLSLTMQPRPLVAEAIEVPRRWPPAPAAPGTMPLWALAPLAAGAFVVNADVSGSGGSVIPEPATILLLGTGLLALGAPVLRRRRGAPATDSRARRG